MDSNTVYRCTKPCKLKKHCFVLKTKKPITHPIEVLHKCKANNNLDILLIIGDETMTPKNR